LGNRAFSAPGRRHALGGLIHEYELCTDLAEPLNRSNEAIYRDLTFAEQSGV